MGGNGAGNAVYFAIVIGVIATNNTLKFWKFTHHACYQISLGKKPVTENAVLTNLKSASLYLNAALGVSLVPDRTAMTVRLVNAVETADNIERYFEQIRVKLDKLTSQVKHAEACGYDVSRVLTASQVEGAKLLSAAN